MSFCSRPILSERRTKREAPRTSINTYHTSVAARKEDAISAKILPTFHGKIAT